MKRSYLYIGLGAVILLAALVLAFTQRDPQAEEMPSVLRYEPELAEASSNTYVAPSRPERGREDLFSGSEQARLTLYVYEDYSDEYSAALSTTLERLKAEGGSDLAFVFRPYARTSRAQTAALAVACAAEQGKWVEMRALLFAKARNMQASENGLAAEAEQIGLDGERFQACLTNTEKSGKIEQLAIEAETYGVRGTPTIIAADELILGARPYEDFVDSNGDEIEGLKNVIARKLR